MLFPHFLKLYLNSIKTINKLYFFWTVYRESNTSNFFLTIFFRRLKKIKRKKHFFIFSFFSQKPKKQKNEKRKKFDEKNVIKKIYKKIKNKFEDQILRSSNKKVRKK